MEKKYYFPDEPYIDRFFGSVEPVCVDYEELVRLADEWEMTVEELMRQVHEASAAEIAEFGTYDS